MLFIHTSNHGMDSAINDKANTRSSSYIGRRTPNEINNRYHTIKATLRNMKHARHVSGNNVLNIKAYTASRYVSLTVGEHQLLVLLVRMSLV